VVTIFSGSEISRRDCFSAGGPNISSLSERSGGPESKSRHFFYF
jgi:hypothetical protein